jgi:hypothetical protein
MADYYLVPGSAKMHILTNGKGSIATNSNAVISSAVMLNVGPSFSTTSAMKAYGAYYTNGYTVMQIPAGDNGSRPTTAGAGYMRYNTENYVIEYYRAKISTWLPLYSPPQLNSIDVSGTGLQYIPLNAATTQYLNLRGYNFESAVTPVVFFYAIDGSVNFISPSVTWKSFNLIVAQVPSGVYTGTSQAISLQSPYSVRVTSSLSGMSQTLINALSVGVTPVFTTSQTANLTLPYFNSRSYTSGSLPSSLTGKGIGNYVSAYDPSGGTAITFSIDPGNNAQYAAPYNLSLSTVTIGPDANKYYYVYIVSSGISNTAVSVPTTITLGIIATSIYGSTTGAFKIVVNPYFMVANYTAGSTPSMGTATIAQAYVPNVYSGYYTALYNSTTNTTPTYTTNTYYPNGATLNTHYPTTWTTPVSSTTFTYNFNVTSLGCPGTTADPSNNNFVDFLLIGGGGGGGNGYESGGGGAGGLISSNSNFGSCGGGSAGLTTSGIPITAIGTYVIRVGGGGSGAIFNNSYSPNASGQPPLGSSIGSGVGYVGAPAFQGDNTTFLGFTAAGGGYGAGEMNYLNNTDGNASAASVPAGYPYGVTSPLQGSTNMSTTVGYGTISSVVISGVGSGAPWYLGPSLYNPRCDWNPLAGGCGGGGAHGQLSLNGISIGTYGGYYCIGAAGNYDPTVSLSVTTINGPNPITGATCITNNVTYTFNQGYGGGTGVSFATPPAGLTYFTGAGGGGAGGLGGNANPTNSGQPAGIGGSGITNSIANNAVIPAGYSGTIYYACGGGGGNRGNTGYSAGGSGSASGGQGNSFVSIGNVPITNTASNGTNGTGTGGGGWGAGAGLPGNPGQAGCGGNGLAIIRYPRVSGIT